MKWVFRRPVCVIRQGSHGPGFRSERGLVVSRGSRSAGTRWAGLFAALLLASLGRAAFAQKTNGIAFWEVDPARVDAALASSPRAEADRFESLRRDFSQFRCTSALMIEQPVGKHGKRNLICTLPGSSPARILVATRYDTDLGRARPTWSDALLLPLLYHALQAQPRQHTFLFAAIDGREGEKVFSRWLRSAQLPQVAIVLDGLGMSDPQLHIDAGHHLGANASDPGQILKTEALRTRQLMGIPPPPEMRDDLRPDDIDFLGQWLGDVFSSTLLQELRPVPSAAVAWSEVGKPVNPPAFHQDLDFLAWLLCGMDLKLDPACP